MEFPDSPFWDFSLALYGSDGVAPACLRLQDRHGVDVNLLFYCIWHGLTRGPLDRAALAAKRRSVADWHEEVVRHLRRLRRRLKSPVGPADPALAQALRARIQKAEIDAEHIEQLVLADGDPGAAGLRKAAGSRADAAANAAGYFALISADAGDGDRRDLDLVLTAACSLSPATP